MPQTFLAMAIYIAAAAIVGLLTLRFGRWTPQSERVDLPGTEERRGWGCGATLFALFLIVVLVVLALWAYMAARP
jgi:hypothetical protein